MRSFTIAALTLATGLIALPLYAGPLANQPVAAKTPEREQIQTPERERRHIPSVAVAQDKEAVDDFQESPVLRNQRSVQRGWFLQAEEALRQGDEKQFQSLKARLEDYPLLPYLELRQLQRRLFSTDSAEVMAVLEYHRDIPHSESIRQQWLNHLGNTGRWQELNSLSQSPLRGQRLQCLALRAELLDQDRRLIKGQEDALNQRVESLWLTGRSLDDACDPLLQAWRSQGGLTDELTWRRMQLALSANNANLARYLRRYLSSEYRELGSQLLEVHHRPQRLKRVQEFRSSDQATSDIVYHGLLQLIRTEPVTAEAIWRHYDESREFTPEQQVAIDRLLGLRLAVRYDDRALPWLQRASQQDSDPALVEWQARVHMRHGDWPAVEQVITAMPELLAKSARWQYWLARAVEKQGHDEAAHELFHKVAKQRHFYGFLAADRVGVHYQLHHDPFVADPEMLQTVSQLPGIQRAQELYHLGRLHHARSEWHRTLSGAESWQVLTAAQLASQWGWHERSVMGTIAVSAWNDLEMRFPLAYQELFTESGLKHNVDINWVFALARQESAFMADARSPKGALGLLQLLPATAAETARKHNLSFNGQESLLEPDINIRLGSAHLAGLLESFKGNRVLATAAYNAGEFRVSQWLENGAEELSTDVWLETMPYYETRQYVQNVMTYTIIYSDRRGYRVAGLLTPQELACACIE